MVVHPAAVSLVAPEFCTPTLTYQFTLMVFSRFGSGKKREKQGYNVLNQLKVHVRAL